MSNEKNPLRESQLRALARIEAFPCLTLVVPLEGGGAIGRPDEVRLRNALRSGREALERAGVDAASRDELLAPAVALLDDAGFLQAPAGGAALFAAPGFFRAVRLESALPELVQVGRRFHLRPLLAWLDRPGRLHVLAISRKRVRVLEAGPVAVERRELAGLPESFVEAVGELQFQSAVQSHTGSGGRLGRRSAIFHGHGDRDEEHFDADLESFFRRVAEALGSHRVGRDTPLVLATVSDNVPLLRRALGGLRVAEEAISGNPDLASDEELAARAREIVRTERRGVLERKLDAWRELRGGGRAADELEPIVEAAERGRVDTLLVAREAERWGSWEPDLRRLAVHESREPGDEDLLDRAVARTLAQGGEVHELPLAEMPEGRIACATLRFP